MVVPACNLSTGDAEAEDYEFEATMDCIMKPCLKNNFLNKNKRQKFEYL
jgi:hypothetical protein